MATFWPSSRRLAMRPPHERAASSGCGATMTWVMASEYSRRLLPPALLADQRDEGAGAVVVLEVARPAALDHEQVLLAPGADRDHEPAAIGELCLQRAGHARRGRGDDDPVPRGAVNPADAAVAGDDRDPVPEAEIVQPPLRVRREARV